MLPRILDPLVVAAALCLIAGVYVLKTTMYDQCRVNHGALYCVGLLIK